MRNITLRRFCPLVFVIATFGGCATNEPYVFSQGEKTASVKFLGMGRPSFCRSGKFYSFTPVENSSAVRIPVGERISVGTYMYFSGYNVSHSCYPFLSFMPKEGVTYVIDSNVRGNKCFVELVREDESKATGVGIEPSVGPRDCYKEK